MKVCWVISESVPSDLEAPIAIATSWGSWETHNTHNTENTVCSDPAMAKQITDIGFQKSSNLYISRETYLEIGRPGGVKLYGGTFGSKNISNKNDIVALNLAVSQYDLILLFGFDLSPTKSANRDEYYFNVRELIKANADTQFVLVDYAHELDSEINELDNVTKDTVESVTSLLG